MDARSNRSNSSRNRQVKTAHKRTGNVRVLRPKRRVRLNVGRLTLLGISIAFTVWAIYPITHRIEQGHELNRLNKQLSLIEKENRTIQNEVKLLQTDEYVEQRARALGLSRQDEEIIVVVPQKAAPGKGAEGAKAPAALAPTLWQRITGALSR